MSEEAMKRWRGKVALVTGATSGIGMAVAKRLGEHGMRVAIAGRRLERLESLASELRSRGAESLGLVADFRDPKAIAGLFDALRAEWGGVDVLVNNAGLGHAEPLASGDPERWREMLEVNILALSICTKEALGDMRGRGDRGHVINLSSMSGHRVVGAGMYSATKFAVRALTEALRQELRSLSSRIRVSSISPGFVETEFHATFFGDAEKASELYSRVETLKPDDIADGIVYALAAPEHVQVHDILVRSTGQVS